MRTGSRRQRTDRILTQDGFGLVWMLMSVAVIGVGLAAIGPLWATDAQRDRERELLRVGSQYAQAIASYYYASPVTRREYPRSLDALLADNRGGTLRRHLRQPYGDPVSGHRPFGLVQRGDGSIVGVYSLSTDRPLRRDALEAGNVQLPPADRYQDWKFIATVGP